MKPILTTICLLIIAHTSLAQQQFYMKSYRVNKYKHYITNSPTASGIVFFYVNPSDTLKPALYIPDFKETDIKDFQDKQTLYNAKICFPDYDSKPRDFIYSITSEGKLFYFYDNRLKSKVD